VDGTAHEVLSVFVHVHIKPQECGGHQTIAWPAAAIGDAGVGMWIPRMKSTGNHYRKLANSVGWLPDEQEGKREMEQKARKLYEDYESAKLRVQLDEHLTRVEKEREISRLTNKLREDDDAAGIRWEITAGFEARDGSEGGSS
jgi:hypothetical protein